MKIKDIHRKGKIFFDDREFIGIKPVKYSPERLKELDALAERFLAEALPKLREKFGDPNKKGNDDSLTAEATVAA